ncbi:MAG: selenocysteine-specific translation elongation factor [Acidobacteria bacterium]|nr:selenocysteine-specific translation elongation factor [Acidobacteriota bacterium]
MKNVIIGTAGHIDHGKTALVKALTGIDADRLKEEKLRGITIDLGFAHMDLDGARVGFIDVPGHEKFVKNMLAGVGGIDLVLLVISADESVMPQTREHFDICRLLGIRDGVVAITKSDLVPPDLVEIVKEEIRELVQESFLDQAEVVPVSARTGEGLDHLQQALLQAIGRVPEKTSAGYFRMPVDRAFSMKGFGTVVTGTLLSGEITRDQEIEILPSGMTTKIRGIHVYGSPVEWARAGQRTALNLHAVAVESVPRGCVLTPAGLFQCSSMIDVELQLLPSSPRALKSGSRVRFHHGTSEIMSRVVVLSRESVQPGQRSMAQLRLEEPTLVLPEDAFIIRQYSPSLTIGGGTVLDNSPPKHKQHDPNAVASLNWMSRQTYPQRLMYYLEAPPLPGLSLSTLIRRTGLQRETLKGYCDALEKLGLVVRAQPDAVVSSKIYDQLGHQIEQTVQQYHRRQPLAPGMPKEELRKSTDLNPEIFRFLLQQMSDQHRIRVDQDLVSLFGRRVTLSDADQDLKQDLERQFEAWDLQPPELDEMLQGLGDKADRARKLFHLLVDEKKLRKVNEGLYLHRDAWERMKQAIHKKFPKGSRFSVTEFKDLFRLSRKYAIPYLEALDRERFTRRLGNERMVV